MKGESMIGEIPKIGAVLNDEGVWEALPHTAKYLNLHYKPGTIGGVEVIFPFGHHAIVQAAADHQAEYTLAEPLEPLPEDAVS
jgi:hypothetical protein